MANSSSVNPAQTIFNWVINFLNNNEAYQVLPDIMPGQISQLQPSCAPDSGQDIQDVFTDFMRTVMPGITHWNHPGFFAYFNSSSTLPSVMAEMISAAVNTNSMLWKASPAATEIEQVTLDWLLQMIGLSGFTGITYDGGSTSNFHALAAMREKKLGPKFKKSGWSAFTDLKPRIYITEQTHNSIHKALITLGFGTDSLQLIDLDDEFKMNPINLLEQIRKDRRNGYTPLCVVATLGSTSCTSLDPVDWISAICENEELWFHIDAAHGGCAAIVDEIKEKYKGWEFADSIVINPHKWLFVPLDLSVLYVKDPDNLKSAFHYGADYLDTRYDERAINYMDYGIPLGRRFRCLKLWFALKCHGVEFFKEKIQQHLELGTHVFQTLTAHPEFEIMAPKPLSTTCFRAIPKNGQDPDTFNEHLMHAINQTGRFFISHTKLNGHFTLRHVISGYKTESRHIEEFLSCLMDMKKHME